MSWDLALEAARERFSDNWTTTAILYQNEDIQRPKDGEGRPLPFVYLEIIGGNDEQMSIGSPGENTFRRTGLIFAHVFVPVGSGDLRSAGWCHQIGNIFRGQTIDFIGGGGSLSCWGADIGGAARDAENGLYWRRSVSVPFWTDDTA